VPHKVHIAKSAWHQVVHFGGDCTGDVRRHAMAMVVLARAGQTNSATTLNLSLPIANLCMETGISAEP